MHQLSGTVSLDILSISFSVSTPRCGVVAVGSELFLWESMVQMLAFEAIYIGKTFSIILAGATYASSLTAWLNIADIH